MEYKTFFSIASGIISFIGCLPYLISIFRYNAKPSKASWLIWTILDAITISGMYLEGASINGQLIMGSTNALIITLISFKYGEPGWKKIDKYCLSGALIGIILWIFFDDPMFGILISLGIMHIGAIPTLFSAWQDPSKESGLAWTLFAASSVCGLIATPDLQVKNIVQPLTFLIINSSIALTIFIKSNIRTV
jgi:hypothetical protein